MEFVYGNLNESYWNDRMAYWMKKDGDVYKPIRKITVINPSGSSNSTDDKIINFIEDINGDGLVDFYNGALFLSQQDSTYYCMGGSVEYPYVYCSGMDFNGDGRVDYKGYVNESGRIWTTYYQKTNHTFVGEGRPLVKMADYEYEINEDVWGKEKKPDLSGAFKFSAVARSSTVVKYERKMVSVDLNDDGLLDVVDQASGIIYFNAGDNTFVKGEVGGYLQQCDVNNDGLTDILKLKEGTLSLLLNDWKGDYKTTVLYKNAGIDPQFFCMDIDNDGDQDILVLLSYVNTGMGSFAIPFINDGEGNFEQLEEWGSEDKLCFQRLVDIDGDGNLDILAIEAELNEDKEYPYKKGNPVKVVCMRGDGKGSFGAKEVLAEFERSDNYGAYIKDPTAYVLDIDGDGILEVWVGEVEGVLKLTANAVKPVAPSKPSLYYDASTATLKVSWGDGADERTSKCDLRYNVRIGTKSGASDILNPKSDANGRVLCFTEPNCGLRHSYTIDLKTYAPSDLYVSVQAVNNDFVGSEWSEDATVAHTFLPVFEIEKKEITYIDSVSLYYTPLSSDYTQTWDLADATVVESEGQKVLKFATSGLKTLTLTTTAPDGQSSVFSQSINVLPNGVVGDSLGSKSIIFSYNAGAIKYCDYNGDGLLDLACKNGIYKNNGNGKFVKVSALWNTGLDLSYYAWMDYDRDGFVDLVYVDSENNEAYLKNSGKGSFTNVTLDEGAVSSLFLSGSSNNMGGYFIPGAHSNYRGIVDFNGDGLSDNLCLLKDGLPSRPSYVETYVAKMNNGDGTFMTKELCTITKAGTVYGVDGVDIDALNCFIDAKNFSFDVNGDGLIDALKVLYVGSNYYGLRVYLNNGDFTFTIKDIMFAQEFEYRDFNLLRIVDVDGDGYLDVIANKEQESNKRFYVLFNNGNESFGEPVYYEYKYDIKGGYYESIQKSVVYDINHDGKNELVYVCDDVLYSLSLGRDGSRKVCSLGAAGYILKYDLLGNGMPFAHSYSVGGLVTDIENEAPSSPTGIVVSQDENGIHISWNDAQDDATSAGAMRYNLSVKHKGKTGAGAYIISPLTNGDSKYTTMPCLATACGIEGNESNFDYPYLRGTRYTLPISATTAGEEIEISVQAIDGWGMVSEFSAVKTFQVGSEGRVKVPQQTCSEEVVTISYNGTPDKTKTPVWDFDGADIVSGEGYGPYEVSWDSAGEKVVSLTIGEEVTNVYVTVSGMVSAEFELPEYLLVGKEMEFDLPNTSTGAKFVWETAETEDGVVAEKDWKVANANNGIVINAVSGQAKGTLRVTKASDAMRALRLTVSDYGCSASEAMAAELIAESDAPQIKIVNANAKGQNVIEWKPSKDIAPVAGYKVLRETSRYDEFVVIGEVSPLDSSFTDLGSNSARQSERYKVQTVYYGDNEGYESDVHQTIHLKIFRGIRETDVNLVWNAYKGRDVVTYRLLRGATPDDMEVIAEISAANLSYTDMDNELTEPYYAIQYELSGKETRLRATSVGAGNYVGISNIVNRDDANTVNYVETIKVFSATENYTLSEDTMKLYLYADIMPVNATKTDVIWSVTKGADLATIDQFGVLTAVAGQKGGTVEVTATSTDGSKVTGKANITVKPIGGGSTTIDPVVYTISATCDAAMGTVKGAGKYEDGETVTLTATAKDGYEFVKWSDGTTSNPYTFKASKDVTLTAVFKEKTTTTDPAIYTIAVTCNSLRGTVTGSGKYEEGKTVTLKATAKDGFEFEKWSNDETANPYTFTASEDLTLTAIFKEKGTTTDPAIYTIAVSCNSLRGTVTGAGRYEEGKTVTLKATAKDGFEFEKWSNDETANPYTFTASEDLTLTAIFKEKTVSVELPPIYLFGAIPGSDWSAYAKDFIKIEDTDKDGVFVIDMKLTEDAWFGILSEEAVSCNGNWDCVNRYRYSPSENGQNIAEGETPILSYHDDMAFMIPKGNYTIKIDWVNMTIIAELKAGAVSDVLSNDAIVSTEYYDMLGRKVTKTERGVYLVRYVYESGKIEVKKVVVME